jgi:hypothetical protein
VIENMLNGQKLEIRVGGDFAPIPADKYTCQIADVKITKQLNFTKTAEEEVFQYKLVILDEKEIPVTEGEEPQTTRGRFLFRNCSPAFSTKSWLGKLATAVYGRELSKEEMEKFDAESIIGRQVDALVQQNEGTGKNSGRVFANIVAFTKTTKPLSPMSDNEIATAQPAVEKTSTPAVAPSANDPEAFIAQTEKEGADAKSEGSSEDDEVAAMEKKLAEAKEKAKAKAKELTA